jgi:hypothetical protein
MTYVDLCLAYDRNGLLRLLSSCKGYAEVGQHSALGWQKE